MISGFSKLYPNVGVTLLTGNQQEIGNALRGDNLDFPIMGRPPDIDMEEPDRWDHRNLVACRPSRSLPLKEDEAVGPYSSRIE
jgi:DNA-binding transcriptional LysR family regulator